MQNTFTTLRAAMLRAMFPMQGPRLIGALTTQICANLAQPLTVAAAAIDGYATAHKAVLRVQP